MMVNIQKYFSKLTNLFENKVKKNNNNMYLKNIEWAI